MKTEICMYVVVITSLMILPGGLGQVFHPTLYRTNYFAPTIPPIQWGQGVRD